MAGGGDICDVATLLLVLQCGSCGVLLMFCPKTQVNMGNNQVFFLQINKSSLWPNKKCIRRWKKTKKVSSMIINEWEAWRLSSESGECCVNDWFWCWLLVFEYSSLLGQPYNAALYQKTFKYWFTGGFERKW